jgi:hypothetical protein
MSTPSINMNRKTWYDVYASTGISAGTEIEIHNNSSHPVFLVESATEPTRLSEHHAIGARSSKTAKAGNVGVWAFANFKIELQVSASPVFKSVGSKTALTKGSIPYSAFGEMLTAKLTPQIQISFEYTVDNTEITTNSISGGGTVTQAGAMAVCTTSTTTGSKAHLQSKRHAKYRAGLGGMVRFTFMATSSVAGTEQLVGLSDEAGSTAIFKNGLVLGYVGETFGFYRYANDIEYSYPLSTWDDPLDGAGESGQTLDPTKLNVFFIDFQYLGAGAIRIYNENTKTGEIILVHTIPYSNLFNVPSSYNPNYHITLHADNKATTANLVVKAASLAYFIQGETKYQELQQPQFSTGEQTKATVTTEVPIVSIRNKATYASKINFIDILLEMLDASIEAGSANNLGKVRIIRDAALTGAVWSDINTTNSVVEYDTTATAASGGKEIMFEPLAGKNDKAVEKLADLDIIIAPNETVTISGQSANSATINAGLLWKELF